MGIWYLIIIIKILFLKAFYVSAEPLPKSLFDCQELEVDHCPIENEKNPIIYPAGGHLIATMVGLGNVWPNMTWGMPLNGHCCVWGKFRQKLDPFIEQNPKMDFHDILAPVWRRSAGNPFRKKNLVTKELPEYTILFHVVRQAAAGNKYGLKFNKTLRMVFDANSLKYTSVIQYNGNPFIQAEQYISPNVTVSLGRFHLAKNGTFRNSTHADRLNLVNAIVTTNIEKQVVNYTRITGGPLEVMQHRFSYCHHELAYNARDNTYFTMCQRSNATLFEFDSSGKVIWRFYDPRMHDRDTSRSHFNSLSYDAASDDIIVNDLKFAGLFSVSRRRSRLKWCIADSVGCDGAYVCPALGVTHSTPFRLHMHQIHHIGTHRYLGYVNFIENNATIQFQTGFAIMVWRSADKSMIIPRQWLADERYHYTTFGGVALLPGGNVLLTLCGIHTLADCSIASVDPDGNVSWRLGLVLNYELQGPIQKGLAIYRFAPKLKRPFIQISYGRIKTSVTAGLKSQSLMVEIWPIIRSSAPLPVIVSLFSTSEADQCQNGAANFTSSCVEMWTSNMLCPPHWAPLVINLVCNSTIMQYRVKVVDQWGLEKVVVATTHG